MSIIKLPIQYEGSEGEKTLYTLFDSGSTFSCINADYVKGIENLIKLRHAKMFETASQGHFVEIKYVVRLDFYIDDILLSDEFMVVPNLSEEAILGVTTMQKWRIKLDFDTAKVVVDPKVGKFILKELK
jgi:hypothetical protein